MPIHTASSSYDVSWLVPLSTGHFDLTFDQQINGPSAFASSSGNVYLTTDTDLFLNLSATLTFSSAAVDEADFGAGFLVKRDDLPTLLFNGGIGGGTGTFGYPPSGSVGITRNDLLLLASHTYLINYTARTNMGLNQQPHQPLLASGTIHFDWRPVPEPASALLLAFAAFALGTCRSPARRWIRDS